MHRQLVPDYTAEASARPCPDRIAARASRRERHRRRFHVDPSKPLPARGVKPAVVGAPPERQPWNSAPLQRAGPRLSRRPLSRAGGSSFADGRGDMRRVPKNRRRRSGENVRSTAPRRVWHTWRHAQLGARQELDFERPPRRDDGTTATVVIVALFEGGARETPRLGQHSSSAPEPQRTPSRSSARCRPRLPASPLCRRVRDQVRLGR